MVETIQELTTGYGLIEGPVWHPNRGLLFSDVINGGVFQLDEKGTVGEVIEHRRGIGGIALHESGGLIVSGRNIALKPIDNGPTQILLEDNPDKQIIGFNDLTTDATGRIYAGSLAFRPVGKIQNKPKPGSLFCIENSGSSRVVGHDVMLTNGLGFSPDGKQLYHSESLRNLIRVYDVKENGDLDSHRTFAAVENGIPDGLAVAEDGSVWVAIAHGNRVDVFKRDGRLRQSIACNIPMVTSVCFGGADLRTLYIVTGSDGSGRDNAGTVFSTRVTIPGVRLARAKTRMIA